MKEKVLTRQVAIEKSLMIRVNMYCAKEDIRAKKFITSAIKKALESVEQGGNLDGLGR